MTLLGLKNQLNHLSHMSRVRKANQVYHRLFSNTSFSAERLMKNGETIPLNHVSFMFVRMNHVNMDKPLDIARNM